MTSPRTLDAAIGDSLPAGPPEGSIEPSLRAAIGRAWIEHAASERAEASALAAVAAIVLERSGPGDLHWIAARATSDELRHAAICVRVAQAYDGALSALPEPRRFGSTRVAVPEAHEKALRVVMQCCVQETLAAAYLERAHAEAVEPLPRSALRMLLADEIDHGRIGYAFAAMLSAHERRALRAPLAALVESCVATWRMRARALPPIAAPEHGVLSAETIESTIDEALRGLVLPGLAQLDLA